jgi:hypothetical protein
MARKLQQKLQKVSVYIRIRLTDGSQPYCPAIWESKKRLRPHWCLVRGKPEHHPEGVYHVRYRVNGKPIWEKVCVGDDSYGAADLAALWSVSTFRLESPLRMHGSLGLRNSRPSYRNWDAGSLQTSTVFAHSSRRADDSRIE